MEVDPVALEQVVLRNCHHDEEISRRTSKSAALPFTGKPQPHAAVDTGRNRHIEGDLTLGSTLAGTVHAGVAAHPTRTTAGRACLGYGKKPATERNLTYPLTGTTGLRGGAGLGARPGTTLTGFAPRHPNRTLHPSCRFLERELQRVLEIVSAARSLTRATLPSTENIPEPKEISKNVCKIPERSWIEARKSFAAYTLVAEAIVPGSLSASERTA
jgi:hypothetical protein